MAIPQETARKAEAAVGLYFRFRTTDVDPPHAIVIDAFGAISDS